MSERNYGEREREEKMEFGKTKNPTRTLVIPKSFGLWPQKIMQKGV